MLSVGDIVKGCFNESCARYIVVYEADKYQRKDDYFILVNMEYVLPV